MVTLATLPCFTSSMNWEYSIPFCPLWRVLNWLNTVISTSAITSQIATFLMRLFKDTPRLERSRSPGVPTDPRACASAFNCRLFQALRHQIDLAGTVTRCFRLAHYNRLECGP